MLKKLAGETVVYGASSILGRFLNYLLVPFYTHIFHPEEFGVVTELYAYAAFLNIVFTFGMETTYFRYCNKEGAEPAKVFQNIQSLLIISTLLLCGVGFLFSNHIAASLQYPDKGHFIKTLLCIIGIDTLLALSFAKLRLEGKAKKFAFVKLFNILLNIGLNILFLVVFPPLHPLFKPSVEFVLYANLLANLAQIVFFPHDIISWFRFSIPPQLAKQYFRYGFPLMVMGLAGMVNEVIDRVLLKFLLPDNFYPGQTQLAALGVYGACYKLSIFMSLGIQAFRYAAEPFFFARARDKKSPELYAKVMHYFTFLCCSVLLMVSFNLDWIQFLLSRPEYRFGMFVVPILLSANLFLGTYYNLSIWYKLTDKTSYGMWISIGGGIITFALNLALIPKIGYEGCAWATLICYGSMTAASYFFGHKHYPVPYNVLYLLFCICICGAIAVSCWNMQLGSEILHTILYKNAIGAGILLLLFVIGKKVKAL